jgi:hypothetical protein
MSLRAGWNGRAALIGLVVTASVLAGGRPASAYGRWDPPDRAGFDDLRWLGAAPVEGQSRHLLITVSYWRHVANGDLPAKWRTTIWIMGPPGFSLFVYLLSGPNGGIVGRLGYPASSCCGHFDITRVSSRVISFDALVPGRERGVFAEAGSYRGHGPGTGESSPHISPIHDRIGGLKRLVPIAG